MMYISPNFKEPAAKIEFVEGYSIFITRRALDDAVDGSRNNGTRLIWNLMNIFFSEDELSKSNGKKTDPGCMLL